MSEILMKKRKVTLPKVVVGIFFACLIILGVAFYNSMSEWSKSAMKAEIQVRIPRGTEEEYLRFYESSFLDPEVSCSVSWKYGWNGEYIRIGHLEYENPYFPFRDGNYDLEWLEDGVTITCYTPDGEVIACETFCFPD